MTDLTDRARTAAPTPSRRRRVHPAWIVAAVAFVALVGAAGFRAAPAVVPLVLLLLRDSPADLGVQPYGAPPMTALPMGPAEPPVVPTGDAALAGDAAPPGRAGPGPARVALLALRDAARTTAFWALAVGFAICGASTNGLIGTRFDPAAHDHGMAPTVAAGLLAVVGVFDVVGTIASGWLTDRYDPRVLLLTCYGLRGVSLALLPLLLTDSLQPSVLVFVVVYGLDWVATVPPTVALCRELFGDRGPVVFGWVFAAHQVGAAVAAGAAGLVRDVTGEYTLAWTGAAGLCAVAAVLSVRLGRRAVEHVVPTRL